MVAIISVIAKAKRMPGADRSSYFQETYSVAVLAMIVAAKRIGLNTAKWRASRFLPKQPIAKNTALDSRLIMFQSSEISREQIERIERITTTLTLWFLNSLHTVKKIARAYKYQIVVLAVTRSKRKVLMDIGSSLTLGTAALLKYVANITCTPQLNVIHKT